MDTYNYTNHYIILNIQKSKLMRKITIILAFLLLVTIAYAADTWYTELFDDEVNNQEYFTVDEMMTPSYGYLPADDNSDNL